MLSSALTYKKYTSKKSFYQDIIREINLTDKPMN